MLVEFCSHLEYIKNEGGLLIELMTFVQGKEFRLDEVEIALLLGIDKGSWNLPRTAYLCEFPTDPHSTFLFRKSLCFASDHRQAPMLIDKPIKLESKYLTKECQFLALLHRRNVMPVRIDRLVEPCDLKLIQ